MTDPANVAPPPPPSTAAFASWGARVVAAIIDQLPIGVAYFIFAVLFGQNTAGAGSFSTNLSGVPALVFFVIAIGWLVYNWGVKQGGTGKTLGKGVMKIAVFKVGTTEALGTGLSIGRQFVHILDAIPCYLGYLWPLWDSENRTFADMILNTRVYKA
ncbi:MAG: RDD family protein [Aeromicrobium sp.]